MASLAPAMVAAISAKLTNIIPAWMMDAWNWANGDAAAPAKQVPAISNSGTARKGPQNRGQKLVARDAGGPVRPGQGYEVGERGPEFFMPGVAGSILPTRVLQAAIAAASIAGPAAALPSLAEINLNVAQRPALQPPAPVQQITRQGDTIPITIPTTSGQNAQDIALAVRAELERIEDDRRADLHDGGIN
jgi:hypothetical protein